jgi:hypothetical protein
MVCPPMMSRRCKKGRTKTCRGWKLLSNPVDCKGEGGPESENLEWLGTIRPKDKAKWRQSLTTSAGHAGLSVHVMSYRYHDTADKIQGATDQHGYASSCRTAHHPAIQQLPRKPRGYTNPFYGICTTCIWKIHLLWVRCRFTIRSRSLP